MRLAAPGVNLLCAVGIAALALTAGLTAACFVKAVGITFLALPRSADAAEAHEATGSMRWAMAALAATCVALGLGAAVVVPALGHVSAVVLGAPAEPVTVADVTIAIADDFAALSPAMVAAALLAGLAVPWLLLRLTAGHAGPSRTGETWGCGRLLQTARMEYTAAAFADPFKRVFRFFYRPVRHLQMDVHPESRFFVRRIEYSNPVRRALRAVALWPRAGRAAHDHRPHAGGAVGTSEPVRRLHPRRAARPAGLPMMVDVALALLQVLIVAGGAPLLVGTVRTMKARLTGRRGPRPLQPYADLAKLLRKGTVVSTTTSWIFRATPYVLTATMLVAALIVPVMLARPVLDFAGLVLLMYLFVFGTFFLALAGLDAGSAFGGMGSSREVAVAALAEPTIMIAILALALRAETTNLGAIVERFAVDPLLAANPGHLLAFGALFIVMLAETGRLPVDNPATHLELTMIHEAMVLEYSGRHLALVEWASAMKLFLFMALLANLFFPWGMPASAAPLALLLGLLVLVVKLLVLATGLAVIETLVAKLRLFRVPELLAGSFALAVLSVLSVFLLR